MEFFTALSAAAGSKLLFAVLILIAGQVLIKHFMRFLEKGTLFDRAEGEVRTFFLSFIRVALYVLLIISIIGILGVPTASIVTVLASAGVTLGLALQGALSNLAGGIMLLFFRPFKVGDYIIASGVEGNVRELTLFYTVIVTVDNKRITVPNGSLMNANIVNCSSEPLRRVDLTFACGKGEDPANVQRVLLETVQKNPLILQEPAPPFARLCGGTNESMEFAVKVWVNGTDYWDVYFDLTQAITEALNTNGISVPAVRFVEHK